VVFWVVMAFSVVVGYRCVGRLRYFHLQGEGIVDGGGGVPIQPPIQWVYKGVYSRG